MLPMPCDVPDDVELARLKSSELTRGLGGNADRHAISQGRRPKDQKLAKVLRVTCTEAGPPRSDFGPRQTDRGAPQDSRAARPDARPSHLDACSGCCSSSGGRKHF